MIAATARNRLPETRRRNGELHHVAYGVLHLPQARSRRARAHPLSRRARTAHLRQHLEGRLAAVARASDDAHERIPAVPDRAQSTQVPRRRDGEIPVRSRLRQAGRIRRADLKQMAWKNGSEPFSEPFSASAQLHSVSSSRRYSSRKDGRAFILVTYSAIAG